MKSAGILAALGLDNNICSAARSRLLDSRLSVDPLMVVSVVVHLPVPRLRRRPRSTGNRCPLAVARSSLAW